MGAASWHPPPLAQMTQALDAYAVLGAACAGLTPRSPKRGSSHGMGVHMCTAEACRQQPACGATAQRSPSLELTPSTAAAAPRTQRLRRRCGAGGARRRWGPSRATAGATQRGGGGDFKRTRQAARPHPRLHRPQQPQPSLHASRRICSDMHRGSAAPRHPGPTCRMCSSLASPLVLKQYSTPSSPRQYAHSPRGDRQNDRKLPPAALPLKKLEITWGREARGDALSANPSCVGVEALPRGATTPAACRRARAAHLALHRHEVQRAAAVTHKQLVGVHGVRRHRVDGQVLAVGRLRRPAGGPVRRSDGWLLHRSPAGWPP